jgi:hypothetical protein
LIKNWVQFQANRFLQGDVYAQMAILEKMADLVERQPMMEEAMAELLLAWNSMAKTQMYGEKPNYY